MILLVVLGLIILVASLAVVASGPNRRQRDAEYSRDGGEYDGGFSRYAGGDYRDSGGDGGGGDCGGGGD